MRRWRLILLLSLVSVFTLAILAAMMLTRRLGVSKHAALRVPFRPVPCEDAQCTLQCDAGDLHACHVYAQRHLMPKTTAPAVIAMFEKACAGGMAASCWTLGDLYERGLDVPKDTVRSESLHKQAFTFAQTTCEQGNAWDCNILGLLYARGLGVQADQTRALEAFQQAAQIDTFLCLCRQKAACTARAKGYGFSSATTQLIPSPDVSRMFYNRACALGDATACEHQILPRP